MCALPSREELKELFLQKHGRPEEIGWAPRRRFRFEYYLPADVYEATVKKHVFDGCAWIDIGGGHSIFPENAGLACSLASRCSRIVAVDPSENIDRNTFVHQRSRCVIEDYHTDQQFDLATLRMVAEHISDPSGVVEALQRLLRPGGKVIILTVNLWSPITLVSQLTPFSLHNPVKKMFWGGEEKDTFPVQYKMNTRKGLRVLFEQRGFGELAFVYLDDLSTFGRYRRLNYVELMIWRLFRRFGIHYPETCLLGVYVKHSRSG